MVFQASRAVIPIPQTRVMGYGICNSLVMLSGCMIRGRPAHLKLGAGSGEGETVYVQI